LIFLSIVSFHYKVPQKILLRGLGIFENNKKIYTIYDIRMSLFSEYNNEYRVVMLGDSITAGVEWNELLGISNIANRGIGGDTTDGFYNRLETIYSIKPEICFIMGGINDICSGVPVVNILSNMKKIIEGLKERNIRPIVQSTLYVSQDVSYWKKVNKSVDELNNVLKKICLENDVIFIDLNNILSENGKLKNEYTHDGVHLLGTGYREWCKLIKPIIENK
jgi:lysophospholipase L1-like esterase